jgi:hypothetical protein
MHFFTRCRLHILKKKFYLKTFLKFIFRFIFWNSIFKQKLFLIIFKFVFLAHEIIVLSKMRFNHWCFWSLILIFFKLILIVFQILSRLRTYSIYLYMAGCFLFLFYLVYICLIDWTYFRLIDWTYLWLINWTYLFLN